MFGRSGSGVMGDRFGAKRVLVAGLLVQAFGALSLGAFLTALAFRPFVRMPLSPQIA